MMKDYSVQVSFLNFIATYSFRKCKNIPHAGNFYLRGWEVFQIQPDLNTIASSLREINSETATLLQLDESVRLIRL